jgi:hypothetical protein
MKKTAMSKRSEFSINRRFFGAAWSLSFALAAFCLASASPQKSVPAALSYEKDIFPILRARCLGCHQGEHPQAGFDARTLGRVLEGGHSGAAVTPGSAENSLLYRTVASGKMPPAPATPLNASELARIKQWINSGAKGKTAAVGHWAFRPVVRPQIPNVPSSGGLSSNPIDRFLLAALQQKGLTFSAPADRRTLLRRVTFDLIGLPPTPQEVDAFLADTSPNAYGNVVNRLLASPHYGERWARHWLDTAGYADSEGVLEEDRIRPNAWRYRDYVICSLNADKPYDQFLREQIAGDELVDYRRAQQWTPEIEESLTATGFLRTAVDATRDDFNTHQFTEYQYRMLHDTQTILVSSTLGLTLQCARCHDHKYEPLSQKDYYRVQAILAGAIRPTGKLLPTNRRQIVNATLAEQKRAKEVNESVAAEVQGIVQKETALLTEFRLRFLDTKLGDVPEAERDALKQAARTEESKRTAEQKTLTAKHKALLETTPETLAQTFPKYKQQRDALLTAKTAAETKRITLAELRALYDQDAAPPPTRILLRGEWTNPGDPVEPGIPAILNNSRQPFTLSVPSANAETTGRRRALADWITRPQNPLTARVIVNRVWMHHFGVGLVSSPDNFGRSGALPVNRPLLDWLACELVRGVGGQAKPWTLKALHRLIVTSAAYRQASAFRAEAARKDPENRLLWRQRSRRVEAEAMRDSMLAAGGNLDTKMFGEPVGEEARVTGEIVPVGEDKGGRRSIYLLVRRSKPVTLLNTFDTPVMETNCTRRTTSTTATQALALLNSGFTASQARHFAARVLQDTKVNSPVKGSTQEEAALRSRRVEWAYRLALSRRPKSDERTAAEAFLRDQTALYAKASKLAAVAEEHALADFCLALLSANEFVYVD